jgi:hypothetical protein
LYFQSTLVNKVKEIITKVKYFFRIFVIDSGFREDNRNITGISPVNQRLILFLMNEDSDMFKNGMTTWFLMMLLIFVEKSAAHVILDYPVGGETFSAGETVRIDWHLEIQHAQLDWDLYLSIDGGDTWEAISLDIDIDRTSYHWTVPEIATDAGRIQIVQDNNGADYIGESTDFTIRTAAALEDAHTSGPGSYKLFDNYPNPFNPNTIINYELQITNSVDLSIYNSLGQKVATLVTGKQSAGFHQVEWDASGFASGVYFYKLQAGEFVRVKKMILMR